MYYQIWIDFVDKIMTVERIKRKEIKEEIKKGNIKVSNLELLKDKHSQFKFNDCGRGIIKAENKESALFQAIKLIVNNPEFVKEFRKDV